MALVVVRGTLFGEFADQVAIEAIVALIVFAAIGWVAGWIADYLVRDAVEVAFRRRVDWYRQGVAEAGLLENKPSEEP
ncbi:hypothetical protein CA13_45450 [Planctomycetes bacterium CA13]|uniref:Uncharacterized protein n=2 Tax=Novipirellula herctigrandis TaxID=2527986 RepID=A0A5C5Z6X7_9BACT|nr:hypothetical protein CA13_45450 [Planctomycetes bacterium CA13]